MNIKLPTISRVYQNHFLDSERWDDYIPRDDDIIIATSLKSGTTWMQLIVMHLIFQDLQVRSVNKFSPWLEFRLAPYGERMAAIEAQEHRRFIKTHLPLDGLPYFPQVKYIVVGRDIRDVGMSLWNHYSNFTPEFHQRLSGFDEQVGSPFPVCPETIHKFWHNLMTMGWFDWESEGYPFWTIVHYVQTWWDFRHLDNILFVHFNNLLSDLDAEIQRIANFLEIEVSADMLAKIENAVTFKNVKANAEILNPGAGNVWKGGAKTFFNKGTNGRWRDVFTADDLTLYDATVARELTPDCARWLENGEQ